MQKYIAKFIGDIAKISLVSLVIAHIGKDNPNYFIIILGVIGFIGFLALSLVLLPKEKK